MGCCVSTQDQDESHFPQKPTLGNRAPPPPPSEEETVKEVLSVTDTPELKPLDPSSKPQLPLRKIDEQKVDNEKILEKHTIFHKELDSPTATEKITGDGVYESASEDVSEVCSLSLSESVSTATFNEKRDEDDEVRQRVFRSPARATTRNRELVPKTNRVVGRSPSRRSDQSPGKRKAFVNGGSVRVLQSREPFPRKPIRGNGPDGSEGTGRRSRSPAVNRSVMGRSTSVRRANDSPGRVRVETGKISKVEENEDVKNGAPNESLENPLVSLECFIFL